MPCSAHEQAVGKPEPNPTWSYNGIRTLTLAYNPFGALAIVGNTNTCKDKGTPVQCRERLQAQGG